MLEQSADFPHELLYIYRRRGGGHNPTFVATFGGQIAGVLSGSFYSDFNENFAFESFALPPSPHGYLERIHVFGPARGRGVGRALVRSYAMEVSERGCTFIGGLIDTTSDPTERTAFFTKVGFEVQSGNFGASPSSILSNAHRRDA